MSSTASRPTTMSVATIVSESARRQGGKTALIVGDETVSYAQLWDQVRAYAGGLRDHGVGRGDRVAILIPNVADFPRAYYAILALGATVIPIHALLGADEIEYVLRDSGTHTVVVHAGLLAAGSRGAVQAGVHVLSVGEAQGNGTQTRLEDLAAKATPIDDITPTDPGDTATILYTSGTTGTPKGAEGSHFSLIEQVNALLISTFDLRSSDTILGTLPLFHTFGQTCVLNAGLRIGATIVLVPKFDGDTALTLLNQHEVDVFFGVPTMYIALLDAATRNHERPRRLRYAVSGGASIPLAVMERFNDVYGVEIHEGYGLTETSPVATFNHVGVAPRPGSIGTPIWGVDVEIARADVEDTIELLPRGEFGELVIRGHNLMKGYLNRPEATEAAIVDGWFRTGDLGVKDQDDYIRILDRKKDLIIRNGYNVYPREVEEMLSRHHEVAAVAVFGVPDEVRGQEIAAVVVRVHGGTVTPEGIIEYAKERIAPFKFPRFVEFVDAFPLNSSGKVLKRELVARYADRLRLDA
ncbi:long-chain fatty acid--CoA ligase [Cryobacterium sp. TMT1-21]|uniref:long-chain-fatty-acid--CoA ligase n=1 Tax=unclassified Cryobacterium TaxID=2649013 RepID=UPI0010699FA9|nr:MULTISPECIES: long-chain fatty acid--CoA ligase [unclassified Cryobacterium]TFC87814.1 long-chain fatty acid--CoA ligase [Cryobacterium sp. TmT2-59]TFD12430.1 long-chain fatty acid--CoA ligase [Cryobacterium sp. TMT1-21]TFD19370.1 long-chain fatty acid--CoA ligase [Cryobacterium sp. TMT2-23]TFD19872.1 long-chain fatty acid--CoA ligase [Cryobacterium sp. TMT4-10]